MSEAQLGLLGWGPDGGPKRAPDVQPPTAASPQAVPQPRVDPDGFDFVNVVYRGKIVGKGRPRVAFKSGHVHTPRRTEEAERDLKASIKLALPPGFRTPDFAVQLLLEIRYPVPGSWSKKNRAAALSGRLRPTCKPDVDNVLKLIGDAGNKLLWLDDSSITSLVIERVYAADAPAIWLRVRRAPIALPWSSAA